MLAHCERMEARMKLSISNIAWDKEYDKEMYEFLHQLKFDGIELAPTRLFIDPYDTPLIADKFKRMLSESYSLQICSIQSIWYNRKEKLFGSDEERQKLKEYTMKAIIFAEHLGANNIVFGSPRNRVISNADNFKQAILFFKELGNYACKHHTVLSIEANPKIYNTNFINTTEEATALVNLVNSEGFKVNLDLGTIIENNEDLHSIDFKLVNHIHISEPYLKEIVWSEMHEQLKCILKIEDYKNYVSIEMENLKNINLIKKILLQFKCLFQEE